MIWLFYTAWLVSDDHIYHDSEILQHLGNFGPVPSSAWSVGITAHPLFEHAEIMSWKNKIQIEKLVFSIMF